MSWIRLKDANPRPSYGMMIILLVDEAAYPRYRKAYYDIYIGKEGWAFYDAEHDELFAESAVSHCMRIVPQGDDTMNSLYVTVGEGEPCQIVGCHPLRWRDRIEPQVFLIRVEHWDVVPLVQTICEMGFSREDLRTIGEAMLAASETRTL